MWWGEVLKDSREGLHRPSFSKQESMSRILFITGSDTNQFDLAFSCIQSVVRNATGFNYKIAFLDLGCNAENLVQLNDMDITVHSAKWEFGIQNHNPRVECRKGPISKPFLRDYFPGYDVYIWLDADTWVQTPEAIELLVKAAEKRGCGFVLEMDRSSKFFHGALPNLLQFMFSQYAMTFDQEIAQKLHHIANINTGVFSLSKESPIWDAWKRSTLKALHTFLNKNPNPQEIEWIFSLLDQIVLNHAVRTENLISNIEFLPTRCNWPCHLTIPSFDEEKQLFVEPYLPNEPIGIIHLTNPWGGPVGELNEPFRKQSQKFPTNNSGKDFYKNVATLTTNGKLINKSLFAKHDAQ